MKHTIINNAIPLEVCDYVKDFFDNRTDLYNTKPNQIRIHQPWLHLKNILEPYLSKYIKQFDDCGGNIFKHNYDYGPHVDCYRPYQMINCLIPIYRHEPLTEKQYFVVFDQYVNNGNGRTWKCKQWSNEVDLTVNKKTELCPYQDELVFDKIEGMDLEFYKKYLEHPNSWPDMYRGLSGTAYEATPGNLILFNSNQIHTSGKINSTWKIGLLIMFGGSLDELLL